MSRLLETRVGFAMREAWEILGSPSRGGVLVIGDHAANHVPPELDLGISPDMLNLHIAYDIGVAGVANLLARHSGFAAFLATYSRLVVDLNRNPGDQSTIPVASDGIFIPGNDLEELGRQARLDRFFHPYHSRLADLLVDYRPALILSVHSFTPKLESNPDGQRPWDIGVLYNEHADASKMAIAYLEARDLHVGDQLPYSGKILNATMNRHAEANKIPYVGIEMRQDLVTTSEGQERFALIFAAMAQHLVEKLARNPMN